MLRVVTDDAARAEMRSALDEVVLDGARRMLAAALEAEVDAYIAELTRRWPGSSPGDGRVLRLKGSRARH